MKRLFQQVVTHTARKLVKVAAAAAFGVALIGSPPAGAQHFTPGPGSSGWGPSWVGGQPPGGNLRPKKLEKALTAATFANEGSVIGLTARLWADAEVQEGHEYQLMYQFRLHTKKGEVGPILGTSDRPTGTAFPIARRTADGAWGGLQSSADINRKDITGMTNLPAEGLVAIRVEPHLYDATAAKFLTPPRTRALIVMATVGDNGRVESVVSLRAWVVASARYDTDKVLDKLADLDEYDLDGNGIGDAIGEALRIKELPTPIKVRLIRAVPRQPVYPKSSPTLWGVLSDFAAGEDAALKQAAKAKLGEAP
ncbi:MAG TPA: hypothetical protein VFW33_01030 [Gemmataceae bacterium]|nr:hypothetical protein [Gemmataceae bacterium]